MSQGPPWAHLLDWDEAFGVTEPEEIRWLAEGYIERGKLFAVYGDMKVGKSLLAQDVAAAIATGRSVLGLPPQQPENVLYLDFENDRDLITERFRDKMAYTAASLKNRLFYASYPELKPLDTPDGGRMACELAYNTRAALIIIDTTSRVIDGAESSNDTFADLYKYTLMPLLRMGHTVGRLDHEGKDPGKGQRGASAKDADIHVLWHLTEVPGMKDVLAMQVELDRSRHYSDFRLRRLDSPLRHEPMLEAVTPVQAGICAELDRIGVPRTASRRDCGTTLRAHGFSARTEDLAAAVRYRKSGPGPSGTQGPGTIDGTTGQTAPDLLGPSGDHWGHRHGTMAPPYTGDQGQSRAAMANGHQADMHAHTQTGAYAPIQTGAPTQTGDGIDWLRAYEMTLPAPKRRGTRRGG